LGFKPPRDLRCGYRGEAATRGRTDRDGRAVLSAVEGNHAILLSTGGWQVACGTVEIRGTEPIEIPIDLGTGEIAVRVVDPRGEVLHGAEVYACGGIYLGVGRVPGKTQVEDRGTHVLPFVREGWWRVDVRVGTERARRDIEIVPPATGAEVVVEMPLRGRLRVRVADGDGEPVSDALVMIEDPQDPKGAPRWAQSTCRNGTVVFDVLAPGRWLVRRGMGEEDIRVVEVEPFRESVVEFRDRSAPPRTGSRRRR
jgi:hypothetical protein